MRLVVDILCGRCAAEHRDEPGRLGTVTRHAGIVVWRGRDRRWSRVTRKLTGREPGPRRAVTLAHPGISDLPPPEWLAVFCDTHGAGWIASVDVLTARGSMPVNFRATV